MDICVYEVVRKEYFVNVIEEWYGVRYELGVRQLLSTKTKKKTMLPAGEAQTSLN